MIADILVWSSLALVGGSIAVLASAFVGAARSRRASRNASAAHAAPAAELDASATSTPDFTARLRDVVELAYVRVSHETQRYSQSEASYAELRGHIVETFARLETQLSPALVYNAGSNFEREIRASSASDLSNFEIEQFGRRLSSNFEYEPAMGVRVA